MSTVTLALGFFVRSIIEGPMESEEEARLHSLLELPMFKVDVREPSHRVLDDTFLKNLVDLTPGTAGAYFFHLLSSRMRRPQGRKVRFSLATHLEPAPNLYVPDFRRLCQPPRTLFNRCVFEAHWTS